MSVEVPRSGRLPAPRSLLVIAGASFVVAMLCTVTLDQPIARAIAHYDRFGFWDRGLDLLEWVLLLPVGVPYLLPMLLVVAMLVAMAVPRLRGGASALTYLTANHVLGLVFMKYAKIWTGRLRPTEWLKQGGDTFWRDGGFSFPSGHVVLFASLIVPMAVLWPRTRPLLAVVVFVAAARVVANAHFVSDVIGAVTLCSLVAWATGALVRPLRG